VRSVQQTECASEIPNAEVRVRGICEDGLSGVKRDVRDLDMRSLESNCGW
jgi:hypothetical protein